MAGSPSREAEIEAERLAENETMLVDGYDIPSLLAQLQQARQERNLRHDQAMDATQRAIVAEAALQQAREALKRIVVIRNAAHPDGAIGKATDMYREADAALKAVR